MNMQQLINIFSSSCVAGCPEQSRKRGRFARAARTEGRISLARLCCSKRSGGNTPKHQHGGVLLLLLFLSRCRTANVRGAERGVRSCFGWREKKQTGERCLCGRTGLEAARHERPLTGPVLGERERSF